jgi:hypothetical protein
VTTRLQRFAPYSHRIQASRKGAGAGAFQSKVPNLKVWDVK